MLVLACVVGVVLIAPYLTWDMESSRLSVDGAAHYALLVVHVLTAMVALVLGPLQFLPAVRRHRWLHRLLGRAYLLVGVVPAALAGIPVALLSGRVITQVGLVIPFVGWLVTAWLAVRAARRGDFVAHRAWMMRNYALTFLAVTSRVIVPLLLLAQLPLGVPADGLQDTIPSIIPIGQVLGWVVNLAVVEFLLWRAARRSLTSRAVGS